MLLRRLGVSRGGHLSVHTEAVETRILHMTPVRQDTQLHHTVHHLTGALGGKKTMKEQRTKE